MRSAKVDQSFKGPGKRIELWGLVPLLLSSVFHLILFIAWLASQPQAFSPWCSPPSAIRLRGLMMNMKMALNTVIPLQLCSLWHTTADGGLWEYETPEPKSTLKQRGRKNLLQVIQISEMTQLSVSSLLWQLPPHYRSSDAFNARQKGNGCMFFYRRPVCQLALKS